MVVSRKHFIIGITGAFGSGKTTAASFFREKDYKVVVLSQILEEIAKKRKLSITRKNLQDIGNEIRLKSGAGSLIKQVLKKYASEKKLVIDGLRNYEEIVELKKIKGSVLLGIIADRDVRFERLKNLKRREKLTKELFEKLDLRDLGVGERITGLQTAICIALADFYIDSNINIKTFYKNLSKFLNDYERKFTNSN